MELLISVVAWISLTGVAFMGVAGGAFVAGMPMLMLIGAAQSSALHDDRARVIPRAHGAIDRQAA